MQAVSGSFSETVFLWPEERTFSVRVAGKRTLGYCLVMRTITHFTVACLLMVLYGGEVCPLIDTLPVEHWGSSVLVAFALMAGARALTLGKALDCPDPYNQAIRQFKLDFLLFFGAGVLMTAWNAVIFDLPVLQSGLKIPVGFACIGFFAALDLALRRERQVVRELEGTPHLELDKVYSTTKNFAAFMIISVLVVGAVIILAVTKDIYWLIHSRPENIFRAQMAIVVEVSFIITVLLGYMLTVALTYSRNMRRFLEIETNVLEQVEQGVLDVFVPSRTRDEFGQIAGYTNRMIEGLRERERIRSVFGKVVSKGIADKLMDMESEGMHLGGAQRDLAVMFVDIRGFTSRTEVADPTVLIADLNAYFKEAVAAVDAHGGVVDKFLGDGLLAVFGLDGCAEPCANAVRCVQDILGRVERLNPELSEPLEVSMGLHRGPVLAGIVGSPDRLEYTVIGDVVNTASRMEGLTRTMNTSVLISDVVHADLPREEQASWKDMGEHTVKGRFKAVRVFGMNGATIP